MCQICGLPICFCQPVKMPPCETCTEDTGCLLELPASCVILANGIDVATALDCNNLLNTIYDCLTSNDAQYVKWCALWAGCEATPCSAPTNVTVTDNPDEDDSVIVGWTMIGGNTYDIYLDDILVSAGVTSPYTLHSVASGEEHTVKIVVHCLNGGTAFTEVTFGVCQAATDFAVNTGLSNAFSLYTTWTMVTGIVYDLYQDGVLKQTAATSPYVFMGLTPNTEYVLRIVSRCSGGVQSYYEITVTTQP